MKMTIDKGKIGFLLIFIVLFGFDIVMNIQSSFKEFPVIPIGFSTVLLALSMIIPERRLILFSTALFSAVFGYLLLMFFMPNSYWISLSTIVVLICLWVLCFLIRPWREWVFEEKQV